MKSNLSTRAVLMRLSIGMPGQNRADKTVTAKVQKDENLGANSGKWVKSLYPPDAMRAITQLDNLARSYHEKVTLPFDAGIGILPGVLIPEYAETMRKYAAQREKLVEDTFVAKYPEFVEWARKEHNGTFQPELYPGAEVMREKFYFRTEPLPVPDSAHFESNVASLLGVDVESVNVRVADAAVEAQKELLRRMIVPVAHMAKTLSKESPRIFETLTGNVKEIAELVPKMNLAGDSQLDAFAADMQILARYSPDVLRDSEPTRKEAARAAETMLHRLSGYKL